MDIRYHPDSRLLEIHGESVALVPKEARVLEALMAGSPEVITRESLIDEVWDGNYLVGEQALTKAIHGLRKHFPDEPPSIQTIPRKGYRLLADVNVSGRAPRRGRIAALSGFALFVTLAAAWHFAPQMDPLTEPGTGASSVPFANSRRAEFQASVAAGKLAYVTESEHSGLDIQLMDAKSRQSILVISSAVDDMAPALSPDGTALAYVERSRSRCEIVVLSLLSQRTMGRRHCSADRMTWPSWDADSRRLVYVGNDGIWEWNPTVDQARILLRASDEEVLARPRFAIDQRRVEFLVYRLSKRPNPYIDSVDRRSAERKTIYRPTHWISDFARSQSGDLYISSARAGQSGVWKIDDGVEISLSEHPANDLTIMGNKLLHTRLQADIDICISAAGDDMWPQPDLAGLAETTAQLWNCEPGFNSTAQDYSPVWIDSNRMGFLSNRSGKTLWYLLDVTNGDLTELVDVPGDASVPFLLEDQIVFSDRSHLYFYWPETGSTVSRQIEGFQVALGAAGNRRVLAQADNGDVVALDVDSLASVKLLDAMPRRLSFDRRSQVLSATGCGNSEPGARRWQLLNDEMTPLPIEQAQLATEYSRHVRANSTEIRDRNHRLVADIPHHYLALCGLDFQAVDGRMAKEHIRASSRDLYILDLS